MLVHLQASLYQLHHPHCDAMVLQVSECKTVLLTVIEKLMSGSFLEGESCFNEAL